MVWRPRETDRDETLETQTAADTIVPRLSAPVWILQHLRPNVTQSIAVRYSQTLTLTRTLTITFAMTDFGYSAPWQ